MLGHENLTNCNSFVSRDVSEIFSNLETTANFSSSNAFEGPEKLLEVWFAPAPTSLPIGARPHGLKSVSAETWKEMLNLVNCKILSVVELDYIDAYLLSESSMFVFPHKLILKTCGTTTLLLGLSRILNIATVKAGFPQNKISATGEAYATPYRVFYSRKKFLFPDKQQGPHRCWENEVEFLDGIFEGGSAYMVGKMNGEHWYLYLTSPNTSINSSSTKVGGCNFNGDKNFQTLSSPTFIKPCEWINDDETLEILMSDLDQEKAKQFYEDYANKVAASKVSKNVQVMQQDKVNGLSGMNGHTISTERSDGTRFSMSLDSEKSSQSPLSGFLTSPKEEFHDDEIAQGRALGAVVVETCGLSEVFPTTKYPNIHVDSYLFSPCGFSVNGVVPAADGASTHYFTVHVTPEPHCSYASFESNVPARKTGNDTVTVVEQVVSIFKPGRFSVTLFEAKSEPFQDSYDFNTLQDNINDAAQIKENKHPGLDKIKGYRRTDQILHKFEGYDLVFHYYEREARQV